MREGIDKGLLAWKITEWKNMQWLILIQCIAMLDRIVVVVGINRIQDLSITGFPQPRDR